MKNKWIPGYKNHYTINQDGRIFSIKSGEFMIPWHDSGGYLQIELAKNGKSKNTKVHILVALTFLGPKPLDHVVNHIDGNKINNRTLNLEYVTHAQNTQHAYNLGLMCRHGENSGHKLKTKQVQQIKADLRSGISMTVLADKYKVGYTTIHAIKQGRNWAHIH